MCGICGIIKFDGSPVESEKIQKMMRVMKHRGPDDEGLLIDNNVGIGFVRLSIIDLSELGHQPMYSNQQSLSTNHYSQNRFVIVHNGEVFNYLELRNELKSKGYHFKSNTDTEVVLNSYIEWGEDCLIRFNGMWAFCIYDTQSKDLFFSRDRYGIKPFYYYTDDTRFIYASEIPAILSVLDEKLTPNFQTIFDYMVFNRTDQTENTFFNGIKKLQHGHNLRIKGNKIKITKWYDLRENVGKREGFRNPLEFKELFTSSVGLRLRSDVPLGVCLSGGLDSSSIVSVLLKDFNLKELNTFSAIYGKGQTGDESEYIMSFGTSLQNKHFTTPTAETLLADLEDFINAQAEPIPSTSPYAQFKVMELAKNHAVVTLDGQGADEELAGYHYFFGFFFKDLLTQFRLIKLLTESKDYLRIHKSIFGLKTFLYFLLPQTSRSKLRVAEKGYLTSEFLNNDFQSPISNELYGSTSLNDALLNHFEFKLEHLLKWEDRNSMRFSLEARVPFLDYRLVEKTLATNSDMIINKGITKHILRDAMKGILPENIRMRKDKIGFETPQDEWFREIIFQKQIMDILTSDSFKKREIIDPSKAIRLYKKHLNKELNIAKEIWKWINLELWFRKFID